MRYTASPFCWRRSRLLVETMRDAVVVPASAIQRGPQGSFVYVVKADKTATVRPVTVGVTQEGEAAITAGLAAGETVVADGAERLREGSQVEVKSPNGPKGVGGPNASRGQKESPPSTKGR